jgi:hypothetical protein
MNEGNTLLNDVISYLNKVEGNATNSPSAYGL